MISAARGLMRLIAGVVVCTAASCGDDDTSAPSGDDTLHITLDSPELTLLAGTSNTVHIAVIRHGYDGELTIRAEGLPTGIAAPDVLVVSSESEATIVFTASADATPGVSNATIRAEPASDTVAASVRSLRIVVRPPGSFSLFADAVSVIPGSSSSTSVTVNRTGGFSGLVTLTVSAPLGLIASLEPSELPGGATNSFLTLVADRALRPGAYFVRLVASSPGFPDEVFDLVVTVNGEPTLRAARPPGG